MKNEQFLCPRLKIIPQLYGTSLLPTCSCVAVNTSLSLLPRFMSERSICKASFCGSIRPGLVHGILPSIRQLVKKNARFKWGIFRKPWIYTMHMTRKKFDWPILLSTNTTAVVAESTIAWRACEATWKRKVIVREITTGYGGTYRAWASRTCGVDLLRWPRTTVGPVALFEGMIW